ncbi:MAG TPA: ABC transporter substrate-binding protein [Candidatus Dormibacteraeota bacterium]|nr:ABC transporter substrate-binding protein [Candidatus Dormibacteraeota bacterium]
MRVGIAGSADSLNPGNGLLTEAYVLYELVYDTPITVTAQSEYVAELATEWTVSDDGLTWTMGIRDDATFHDGEPLTAEDVAFSLTLYRDTDAFPYQPSYVDVFESIEAVDATTVELVTSEPVGNFEYRMSFMYVLPMHIWEAVADDPVAFENEEMIGSGPFKLVEFSQGQFVELGANTDYYTGAPIIDGVIFQTIENSDARVQALLNGDIDVIDEFPVTAVAAQQNAENLKILISDVAAGGSMRDVIFNVTDPADCPPDGTCNGHPALRDVVVRQALATATDKQELIDVAQGGLATPGIGLVPVGLGDFFASELVDYPFDAAAAGQMLEDAGYIDTNGDGIRECKADQDCPTGDLTFRFNFPTDIDSGAREAEILAANWGEAGVKLEIQGLDADTLTSVCCPTFDYDVILWGWGSDPDPQFLLGVLLCTEIESGFSESGYCNPEYDDLYAAQGIETDAQARIDIIHEMQRIALEDVPYIIPYYEQSIEAYRTDRFTGFPEGELTLGLTDPTALTVIRPVE